MSRTFSELSSSHKESIRRYNSIPFDQDFYGWVQNHTGEKIMRDEVKDKVMFFLFADNPIHRGKDKVLKEMGNLFPGVNHFIGEIHKEIGNEKFAIFLQIVESHLLINLIWREFHELYPHIPIYTIHDAILTTTEFAPHAQIHLEERLKEYTSISPRIKLTSPAPLKIVLEESLTKRWSEIKKIKSKSQYDRLKPYVFQSNINRSKKFLEEKTSILKNGEVVGDFL